MSKYIKTEDLRLHLQNLVLDGERLDPKTTRLIIMTLRELPIHEFDDECENGQTTNDCISRKQAIEAVTNTIREKFSLADWYEQLVETGLEIENLIKELPPVTPTEKQDHGRLIDADALIESIKQSVDYKNDIEYLMYANSFIDDIDNLPPVTPTERTGEWKHTMTYYPYCSECEWMPEEDEMTHGYYNYCPTCGAKMNKGGDDNE